MGKQKKKPYVVGLGSIPGVRDIDDIDISNSYVVYLDRKDPTHVRQLEIFVEWLRTHEKVLDKKRQRI